MEVKSRPSQNSRGCEPSVATKPPLTSEDTSNTSNPSPRMLSPQSVEEYLKPALERQKAALKARNEKRRWCAERLLQLRQLPNDEQKQGESNFDEISARKSASQLKHEYDTLQKKLAELHHETQNRTLQLTSLQVSNDSREEILINTQERIKNAQDAISKIYTNCAIDGLNNTWEYQKEKIWELRLRLVLQLFTMHKLQIGEEAEKYLAQLEQDEEDSNSGVVAVLNDANEDGHKPSRDPCKRKNPKGYGKIAGLPLPHAGPIYYALFPPVVLTSALRLVASLTCSIARCFKIDLPHPILLKPGMIKQRDIIESDYEDEDLSILEEYDYDFSQYKNDSDELKSSKMPKPRHFSNTSSTPSNESSPSYLSLINNPSTLMNKIIPPRLSQIGRAWSRPQKNLVPNTSSTSSTTGRVNSALKSSPTESASPVAGTSTTTTSTGEVLISVIDQPDSSNIIHGNYFTPEQYISHATHAIIRENRNVKSEKVTEYALIYRSHEKNSKSKDQKKTRSEKNRGVGSAMDVNNLHHTDDYFSVGLQLLQNNVVALCIRAGVPVDKLWPAEALLLNLYSLLIYCQNQVKK